VSYSYPSPDVANAVVEERRRDSLRRADVQRVVREAGIQRPGSLERLGRQLLYAAGELLISVGQRLKPDELSSPIAPVEPPTMRRA
jgi:hypothetical protein